MESENAFDTEMKSENVVGDDELITNLDRVVSRGKSKSRCPRPAESARRWLRIEYHNNDDPVATWASAETLAINQITAGWLEQLEDEFNYRDE